VLVLALALLAGALGLSIPAFAAGPSLAYSPTVNRSTVVPLAGAVVTSGELFVQLVGTVPSGTTVVFYLDDMTTPVRSERTAPFDLLGDVEGTPRALAVSSLSTGSHRVRAQLVSGGRVTSTFDSVFSKSATTTSSPSPTASPAPTAMPAPSPTASVPTATTVPSTGPQLLLSADSDRSPSHLLSGSTPTGPAYVFLSGSGLSNVRFWLDRATTQTPTTTEKSAPWDLMGGSSTVANPLDVSRLAAGTHTVVARADSSTGPVEVRASFTADSTTAVFPSPSPTPTTVAPSPTTSNPAVPAGSWPSASTTGVPSGVTLRVLSGNQRIITDGAVLDGVHIKGCVDVEADNVTIRNSLVECARPGGGTVKNHGSNLRIVDSSIDGGGTSGNCIGSSRYTLLRADLYNCTDGARANGDVVIQSSWIHHLSRIEGSHNDTIQTTRGSNIRILGNRLEPYNSNTRDPMNAAYILAEDQGEVSDVVVSGNFMNGGNYTVMAGAGMGGVSFTGNSFGRNYRYGPVRAGSTSVTWSGNVWADTGSVVPL